ncbi:MULTISPECIES: FadR/GntR family transcriptional regulator [unclassified Novosphingobium]|uniref:FadR/GntR family transcriptional regulator n=1 Tax=Novosphingobium TaxID=165696 RepID=UPI001446EC98|nr:MULTISPECIES: FCD domain-containing protein [unclassified Novosphingobium]NKJ42310.1 DNA-binding FadR family transcriptional regulator [Novosphingobium sp. SG720]NMN04694.1 DNA-binding FadR family transcriptional regulator [Novosphingobium sp. SG919]NMN85313.1 DNA-binding FadR family transcriptional regulator [Novosphingobium sp. SG916]
MAEDEDLARLRALLDETAARGEERLPPEPRLGETLGVSRGRLRTLLRRLEEEGAIWRHVGKGTFIGPRQMVEVRDFAASFSVGDILGARLILEPQLAAEAAIHATDEDLAAMDACLADMAEPPSFLHWKRLDERLHREIAKAAHNVLLVLLYDTLRTQMKATLDRRLEQVFGAEPGPKTDTDAHHAHVVAAIRQHDPAEAERAMREHLVAVRRHLFGVRQV